MNPFTLIATRNGVSMTLDGVWFVTPAKDVDQKFDRITFWVRSSGGEFELTLAKITDSVWKVETMIHHSYSLLRIGFPEATLKFAHTNFKKTVESGSNKPEHQVFPPERVEDRNQLATRVWDRMVATGDAVYDNERNIYTVI
ncbi:hypothetical protein [Larkinella punicea]|uniref:Uncharacterized protein n=1 Tax=Larkinella punicea TaxID=2315727 RepID=A0A368JDU7_9BACT|nr:hypothetical protein [Larkinella punicea]RCR65850.1 hypothetical protein DUE52_29730 [Larkinella punicea]